MKESNSKSTSLAELFGAVAIRKVNGTIQLRPVRKRWNPKPTANQTAVMNRFKMAATYARLQMEDPKRSAMYAERINGKMTSAYAVAVTDALTAPTVEEIWTGEYNGRIGDIITIRAHDDFKVVRVKVSIVGKNGELLEHGDAVIDESGHKWNYRTTVVNVDLAGTRIIATAYDYPQNNGMLEEVLEQKPVYSSPQVNARRKPRTLHPHSMRPAGSPKVPKHQTP